MRRETDNENWGGPRPNSGRPLKPMAPIEAMERAAELVSKAIKVLGNTPMGDDGLTEMTEGGRNCSIELMSVMDKLEKSIHGERIKKMRDIVETSKYLTVTAEYNGIYTTIDGSLLDGTFTVETGVQGMPPREYLEASGIGAVTRIIQEKGLLDGDWESVGEDE